MDLVAYENSDLSQNPINTDECAINIRFREDEDEDFISLNTEYSYALAKYNFTSDTSMVLIDNFTLIPFCGTGSFFNCNINNIQYDILNNGEHAFEFEGNLIRLYYNEGSVLLEAYE